MPVNEAAEAAYRAGRISYHQLHVANQNPAPLLGGVPPRVPESENPTVQIAMAQENWRSRVTDFQFTHKLSPGPGPGGTGRWINRVTGADETDRYPR